MIAVVALLLARLAPCDVIDPLLPIGGLLVVWGVQRSWSERARWRPSRRPPTGPAVAIVVGVALLVTGLTSLGCP